MVIEALSFKLALDFFTYLKKNKVYATGIRLDFYDRNKHEFTGFADVAEMQSYYSERYFTYDNCFLGDMVAIQTFNADSDIYNFDTAYIVKDVVGSYTVNQLSSFDNQRNKERSILTSRQINFLNKTIGEYRSFYNEINRIYITGIYSPCYAEPGWSENTWYLKSLREAMIPKRSTAEFPYSDARIEKSPPN